VIVFFFQYSIYLTSLKNFTLEEFYENSIKPTNKTKIFVAKRTSKTRL